MKIISRQTLSIDGSKSKLGFGTTGGDGWEVWDRFIIYNGKPLFHIGNVCGTCNFFFNRLENSLNKSIIPDDLIGDLNRGLTKVDIDIAKNFAELLPNDTYEIVLLEILPELVFPNGDKDYFIDEIEKTWGNVNEGKSQTNTEYYRGQDQPITKEDKLFEFVVPLYPSSQLDEVRIKYYEEAIAHGARPTALALSVLDVKGPSDYPIISGKTVSEDSTHWCIAHYLIDGHHKIHAAYRQRKSITLLSYLSRKASWQQIDELMNHICQEH